MRGTFKGLALAGLLVGMLAGPAHGQTLICFKSPTGSGCTPVSAGAPLPVTGTFSASSFTPGTSGARMTQLTVTTSDSSGTLPTNTGSVVVSNVGANPMYCNVNGIAATTSDQYISASGGWFNFGIPAASTTLHCIATGGSTAANGVGGAGLAAGTGGGSGGGGGGGAITAAIGSYAAGALSAGAFAAGSGVDGWDLTQGAIADAAVTAGATGSISAKLRAISRDTATIIANTAAAIPPQSPAVPIGGIGLCDGANGTTNPCTTAQTVLAASTASAAANKPAVVALHPSSGTPATLSPYPFGATPYTATATGTTAATTATLAGASSVTTYICGFSIRANATAAVTGNATVTGVITATLNFTQWTAPLASGLGITEMIFAPCIPASGTNQSVAVVSAAPGANGTVSVTAWGYKL